MTIKIRYNKEFYEITKETRSGNEEIACVDYDSSIEDHVQVIVELLAAEDIPYVLEDLS